MQNLILFICLVIGIYFSGEFSSKMATSDNKVENKHNHIRNNILNLGDIVPDDFVLSNKNIADVQKTMPNRNGMTPAHAPLTEWEDFA